MLSASQLSYDTTGATRGDSLLSSLEAELATHPARLAEVVVEGNGEAEEVAGEVGEVGVQRERKRENSVSEIIEDTFR